MSNVVVREIDVRDHEALHAWWQTSHAARAERPIDMGLVEDLHAVQKELP